MDKQKRRPFHFASLISNFQLLQKAAFQVPLIAHRLMKYTYQTKQLYTIRFCAKKPGGRLILFNPQCL